jgi:polar amino acid transport system permease protein
VFDVAFVVRNIPLFADGLRLTCLIAALGIAGALLGGAVVAACTMARRRALRGLGVAFVELMRNTPVLVQIFVYYFGLPSLGFRPSGIEAAVAALILQNSAYIGEIYRAAIQSIHPRQSEAALALGMMRTTALVRIVLPQALRRALPLLGNQFVAMLKDTSIASTIAVAELTHSSKLLLVQTAAPYEIFGVVALLYLAMSSLVLALVKLGEMRLPIRT